MASQIVVKCVARLVEYKIIKDGLQFILLDLFDYIYTVDLMDKLQSLNVHRWIIAMYVNIKRNIYYSTV